MKDLLRATLGVVFGLLIAVVPCVYGAIEASSPKAPIAIENDRCRVEVSESNGAVTRILDKTSHIELTSPRELAEMRKAGLLVWQAHQRVATMLRPGVTTAEIDALAAGLKKVKEVFA